MVGTMQKIKNALTPGHHHRHGDAAYDNAATGTYGTTAGTGYNDVNAQSAGIAGQPGYGYAETVVATNATPAAGGVQGVGYETAGHHHHHIHGTGATAVVHEGVEAEICNRREYVEVEDRPILKERVERIVEHQPVEKRFVVETRPVGETVLAERAHIESAGVVERVVDRAEGTVCPTGTLPVGTGAAGTGMPAGGMGATVIDSRTTTTYDRCADGQCTR